MKLVVFQDSLAGKEILSVQLPSSGGVRGAEYTAKNIFTQKSWDINIPVSGIHNLVFQMISTTEDLPEGIAMIREIQLGYPDQSAEESAEADRIREELKKLRLQGDQTPIMKERPDFIRNNSRL